MKINVLIVGAGVRGKSLALKMINEEKYKFNIIGFIDDNIKINKEVFNKIRVLGSSNDISIISKNHNIDEIYIAINNINEKKIIEIIDKCLNLNCRINVVSDLFSVIHQKRITEEINEIPIVNTSRSAKWYFYYPKIFSINFSIKRLIDFSLSAIMLIISIPVFLIISILIKLSSKGPVFFKQKRIGLNESQFTLYKFRSMKLGSDIDINREKELKSFILGEKIIDGDTKIINKDNVTWIGRKIRKYSLDELPQLINIFKGEMSFVGPRPCLPYEKENYENWHKKRFNVIPGLTGLWQISGRSEVNFNDMIILDLYYIHNLTPWFDLEIIIKTIPVLFSGLGGK